jgi:iron complex outermembrane receptor protein
VKGTDSIPLPGINVQIKGTTVQTTTDIDGSFRLTLPSQNPGDVIFFSFIGLETREFSIYNKSHFDVILNEDRAALDELVIMGGCTVHWWSPRRTWWRIKRVFIRQH